MALVEFSKHSRKGCVETVAYAHIEFGLKIRIRHRLDRARDYVARSRSLRVAIDDGAASDLEDQYLAARATGKISQATAEKRLDAWVAVSKLHAKSLGDDKLAPKHWNAVFTLEGERARRLAVLERAARP